MLELTDGSVALVDAEDLALVSAYEWRLPGTSRRTGQYPVGQPPLQTDGGDTVFLHRLIAQAGPDDIVLHRNHDTLDNRRENLVVQARQSLYIGMPLEPTRIISGSPAAFAD